ncbi:hypothetical protein SSX86_028158 [Deinandra increscens subsp. villosa]|uniref:Cathepsin propeptide inhibitor domain-containing protein n=1 Tax=Deinandra increscens subsp. villosa TaxID=3103831 RepID=A0AAP0C8V3_9ASTR
MGTKIHQREFVPTEEKLKPRTATEEGHRSRDCVVSHHHSAPPMLSLVNRLAGIATMVGLSVTASDQRFQPLDPSLPPPRIDSPEEQRRRLNREPPPLLESSQPLREAVAPKNRGRNLLVSPDWSMGSDGEGHRRAAPLAGDDGEPSHVAITSMETQSMEELFNPTLPPKIKETAALPQRTLDEEKAMYESYLVEHDKQHYNNNPEEKEMRFQTFRETMRFIDRHNLTTQSMEGQFDPALTLSEDDSAVDDDLEEDCGRTDGEVEAMFNSFIAGHEEFYNTPEEKEKMFQIFRKILMFIDDLNETYYAQGLKLLRPSKMMMEDDSASNDDLEEDCGRTDGEVEAMFNSFIARHEELYNTPEEKEKMFQIFKKTLMFVDDNNSTFYG